jgi:hypothetical protein
VCCRLNVSFFNNEVILSRVCVTTDGVLDWWTDLLTTTYTHDSRLGTTSNYSAIAHLHNSHITTAPAKPFPACSAFTSRSLATLYISWDYSASRAQVLFSQTSAQNWLLTGWVAPIVFLITPRHGPRRNTQFPTVPLSLGVDSLLRERVCRAVAQKRPCYIRPPRGRCIATALRATILCFFLEPFNWRMAGKAPLNYHASKACRNYLSFNIWKFKPILFCLQIGAVFYQ